MIRYQWKVTIQRARTVIFDRVNPERNGKVTPETVVRRHPRLYKTPQGAEQAKPHLYRRGVHSYPPEAKWELEIVQLCPKSYDPLLLTTLRCRMEARRQARSSQ